MTNSLSVIEVICKKPVIHVRDNAKLIDALLTMNKYIIRHVVIVGDEGSVK